MPAPRFIRCLLAVLLLVLLLPQYLSAKTLAVGKMSTHIGWTTRGLYMAMRVDDPMIIGTSQRPFGQPWLDDAVALYLHAAPDVPGMINERTLRIIISAAGGYSVQYGERGEWHDDVRWDIRPVQKAPLMRPQTDICALQLIGKSAINDEKNPDEGYQLELVIPWAAIGFDPVAYIGNTGKLPALKMALVNYSQGESSAVYSWPDKLTDADMLRPASWGTLVLSDVVKPENAEEMVIVASRLPGNALIDGRLDAQEWVMASILHIAKPIAVSQATAREEQGQLILAWYELDPFRRPLFHQPLEIQFPWSKYPPSMYHTRQIQQIRKAGIDALAVQLSSDAEERLIQRPRLADLSDALARYYRESIAAGIVDVPLLLPIIDISMIVDDEVSAEDAQKIILDSLTEFYQLVPPQLRFTLATAGSQRSYPVILLNPSPYSKWQGDFTGEINKQLLTIAGLPAAWILDSAWRDTNVLSGVISYLDFQSDKSYQASASGVSLAMLTPGLQTSRGEIIARAGGDTFRNSLAMLAVNKPELVLLRSWNDFARGSEVSASRMYGFQNQDSLNITLANMANEQKVSFRILNHNLPATLLPGQRYSVDVDIKNNSMFAISSKQGYRIDYQVIHKDRIIFSGVAADKIILLERAAARLHFDFITGASRRNPLGEGEYSLILRLVKNRIPLLSSAILRESVSKSAIPFTVTKNPVPLQLVEINIPANLPSASSPEINLVVRNTTRTAWKRDAEPLTISWLNSNDEVVGDVGKVICVKPVAAGEITTCTIKLPTTPATPGWYRLQFAAINLLQKNEAAIPVYSSLIQIDQHNYQVEFRNITMPNTMSTYAIPYDATILLVNRGLSSWPLQNSYLCYQWLTWDGQPILNAAGRIAFSSANVNGAVDDENSVIKSEENSLLPVTITPPPYSGSFYCAFYVEVDGEIANNVLGGSSELIPVKGVVLNIGQMLPVDLSAYFKADKSVAAIAEARGKINFDGLGNSFPLAEFLPDATLAPYGFQPGYAASTKIDPKAPTFIFGNNIQSASGQFDEAGSPIFPTNGAPTLYAARQVIELPRRKASALYLVATRISDLSPENSFLIRYTDGKRERISVPVSHWLGLPEYDEQLMLRSSHIHTLGGNKWNSRASLFVYKIPLDAERVVSRVMLPENNDNPRAPSIAVFAMTLEVTDQYKWNPRDGKYQEWLYSSRDDVFALDDTYYTAKDSWSTASALLDRIYPAGARLNNWAGEAYSLKTGWGDEQTRQSHEAILKQLPNAVAALSDAYTFMLRGHYGVYAMAVTPDLDQVYRLRINRPGEAVWPARGIITPIVPAELLNNHTYQRYFITPPVVATKPLKKGKRPPVAKVGPAEDDIFGVLNALNNNLHAAMTALPLGESSPQLTEAVTLQLLLALYLRQMETESPLAFQEACANKETVSLVLLLYDRAAFVTREAQRLNVLDKNIVDPLLVLLSREENQHPLQTLRNALLAE